MAVSFKPIEAPKLDSRTASDFIEIGKRGVYEASDGLLNDFSPAGGLITDIEATASAFEELLFWVNRLPEAFLLNFLQTLGIQQSLGKKAVATVVFSLSSGSANSFVVPSGFKLSAGGVLFETTQSVTFPPYSTQASVTARAVDAGAEGNVEAGAIKTILQPLGLLSSANNPDAAKGGAEEEGIDELKVRAFQFLRRRGLISAEDFEEALATKLGKGAFAYAVPNLGADKVSEEKGSVHVFGLNPDGSLLNSAQIALLSTELDAQAVWATIRVSSLELLPIDLEIVAETIDDTNPDLSAQSILNRLAAYLKPGNLQPGKPILIKEIEHQVRLAEGVATVNSAAIYDVGGVPLATNLPLANGYTVGTLRKVEIVLMVGEGKSTVYNYVNGARV